MVFSLFTGSINYDINKQSKCEQVNGLLDPGCVMACHRHDILQEDNGTCTKIQ